MDKIPISCSLHQRKLTKNGGKVRKPRKENPIKVVYISNPMKVKTSASEFMALVQKLTGQDAADLPESPNFEPVDSHQTTVPAAAGNSIVSTDVVVPASAEEEEEEEQKKVDALSFDEFFTPQMLESLSPPTSFCFESDHLDVLGSL